MAGAALWRDHQCTVLGTVEIGPQMFVIPFLAGVRPLVVVGGKPGTPSWRSSG